eukprot:gene15213-biopygen14247
MAAALQAPRLEKDHKQTNPYPWISGEPLQLLGRREDPLIARALASGLLPRTTSKPSTVQGRQGTLPWQLSCPKVSCPGPQASQLLPTKPS